MDAFCGVGGNAIQFALTSKRGKQVVHIPHYFVSSIFFTKNLGVNLVHWYVFFSSASEETEHFFASPGSQYELSLKRTY